MSDTSMNDDLVHELREQIDELRRYIKDVEDERDAETERADEAEREADSLQARVDELEGLHLIDQIARVRKDIKAGRKDDAIYGIERVLDEMDDGSRTWWTL